METVTLPVAMDIVTTDAVSAGKELLDAKTDILKPKLKQETVLKAVQGLLKIVGEKKATQQNLIEDSTKINLQYSFKKIPQLRNKSVRVQVPHSLMTDDTDVCLFVKDVHKDAEDREDNRDYQPSVRHFRKVVDDAGVKRVEEIIPIIRLKREFKEHETKRKLCDSYDLFLADDRICKFLPKLLGKTFFQKRKSPLPVKLSKGGAVANSFSRIYDSVHGVITGKGSSQSLTVGHSGMTAKQVAENIDAVVKHLVTVIPAGWSNIRGLHITTMETTSLPLYVDLSSGDDVDLPEDEQKTRKLIAVGDPGLLGDGEDDDEEGEVEVYDDGTIKVKGGEEEEKSQLTGKKRKKKRSGGAATAATAATAGGKPKGNPNPGGKNKINAGGNQTKSPKGKQGNDTAPKKFASKKGPLSKKPRLE